MIDSDTTREHNRFIHCVSSWELSTFYNSTHNFNLNWLVTVKRKSYKRKSIVPIQCRKCCLHKQKPTYIECQTVCWYKETCPIFLNFSFYDTSNLQDVPRKTLVISRSHEKSEKIILWLDLQISACQICQPFFFYMVLWLNVWWGKSLKKK